MVKFAIRGSISNSGKIEIVKIITEQEDKPIVFFFYTPGHK